MPLLKSSPLLSSLPKLTCPKYSLSDYQMDSLKRSSIKSIVGPNNGDLQFDGQRVLVGGWVKSFHVRPKKEVAVDSGVADVAQRDLNCAEALFLRFPLFRCIVKVISHGVHPVGEKLEAVPEPEKKMEAIAYIRINDGSCVNNFQIVLDSDVHPLEQVTAIGTSVLLEGVIEKAQTEGKYTIELKADKVLHVGPVNLVKYPLSKPRLSLEAIRVYPHFRARTTTVASVMRIRSALTCAMHKFFQENNFHHVTMPIITTTPTKDHTAFHVTQLISNSTHDKTPDDGVTLEGVQAAIQEKTKRIEELKRSNSNKEAVFTAEQDLKAANDIAQKLEKEKKMERTVKADFSKDYFGREAYLSVDVGLHLESYACALGAVYHFGPVFRPVEHHSSKSLAETWVVSTEQVFAELECAMKCAEDCLKSLSNSILTACPDDVKFLSTRFDNKCMDRIQAMLSEGTFPRVSYTEAVEALQKASGTTFQTKVEWGITLSEEHQRYLADELHNKPIIVYNYPKDLKPFYSRSNDDTKTVSAFDVILPKVGTVVSGIQKEERNYMISSRIKEVGLAEEQFDWYLDLRRHGTVKHAGFQINFDQLVMFLTGFGDIRDVVPYPRTKNDAKC